MAAPPPGRSHWDRLPQELRSLVLAHTTPALRAFCRRTRRGLLPLELGSLGKPAREQIWVEVLESGWDGDLKLLPLIHNESPVFLAAASRPMFERLRAAGVQVARSTELRLAVRHGWADIIGDTNPGDIARAAACEGATDVLAGLADEGRLALKPWLAAEAAGEGHAGTVMWLHAHMRGPPWPTTVMDAAAGSGNLDLVVWLHNNTSGGCTVQAIENAAKGGHLATIKWLAQNRSEGCNIWAFKLAANGGHVDVLEFLRRRFPSVFHSVITELFKNAQHLCVLEWLKQHWPEALKYIVARRTFTSAGAEVAKWLCSNTDYEPDSRALLSALENNNVELVDWLVRCKGVDVAADMFNSILHGSNTAALAWVIRHDGRWAGVMAERFAVSSSRSLIGWLHVRHPGSVGQGALEAAILAKREVMVRYLLNHVHGVGWDLVRARDLSIAVGESSVVALLNDELRRQS
ncbi:hypothetical protein HK105_205401 [Polyrhizophydium stewartii]|uniref:Ankyrin repeat protein n=1 Tax=Polyrhizophydium stewartii TaxID=2732419 RepID=A0ABR4N6D1_9FUNG